MPLLGEVDYFTVTIPHGPIKRIHVNQHNLKRNTKTGDTLPVYTVKHGGGTTTGHRIEIYGPSYLPEPDRPLACGARAWLETQAEVIVWKRAEEFYEAH